MSDEYSLFTEIHLIIITFLLIFLLCKDDKLFLDAIMLYYNIEMRFDKFKYGTQYLITTENEMALIQLFI